MTAPNKPNIEPHKGGWMVYLPNGDYAWQPSKQFAEAYIREWRAFEVETGCRLLSMSER